MNTKTIINSLLISSLIVAPYSYAANTTTEKSKNQMSQEQTAKSNIAVKKHEEEQNALLKTVNEGVLEGYNKVLKAAKLLAKERA